MGAIQLKTAIPGPRSLSLAQRSDQAVARGISQLTPIFVERAEGAIIEDVDGNRFLDLAGGIGCLNVGHRAPAVVEALHQQIDHFLHTCFMVTPYESYIALAEKLNALAPGATPKKLCSSIAARKPSRTRLKSPVLILGVLPLSALKTAFMAEPY